MRILVAIVILELQAPLAASSAAAAADAFDATVRHDLVFRAALDRIDL